MPRTTLTMLSILLLPSYRCQTDCVYCYSERPKLPRGSSMSPARWVEILTEAGELGIGLVTFSGGDPLTFEGIDDLLAVAARYEMTFLLPTKCLVTRSHAKQLANYLSDDREIQISVDSFDAVSRVAMI